MGESPMADGGWGIPPTGDSLMWEYPYGGIPHRGFPTEDSLMGDSPILAPRPIHRRDDSPYGGIPYGGCGIPLWGIPPYWHPGPYIEGI